MKPFALLFLVAACATTPPPPTEPAEAPPEKPAPAAAAAEPEKKTTCSTDSECGDGQLCLKEKCVEITRGLKECREFKVEFAFNAVVFEPNVKPHLFRMARCLRADQSLKVSIQGNADERGTEEYNLQLGSKRAGTIQTFLLNLGVSAAQVDTISYGENKPVCRAQDEACFARNRRASVKPEEPAAK